MINIYTDEVLLLISLKCSREPCLNKALSDFDFADSLMTVDTLDECRFIVCISSPSGICLQGFLLSGSHDVCSVLSHTSQVGFINCSCYWDKDT